MSELEELQETKNLMREAINSKGGNLTEDTPFREYAQAILDLNIKQPINPILDYTPSLNLESTFNDLSGNNNHGVKTGTINLDSDNNAIFIRSNKAYVTTPLTSNDLIGFGGFTIEYYGTYTDLVNYAGIFGINGSRLSGIWDGFTGFMFSTNNIEIGVTDEQTNTGFSFNPNKIKTGLNHFVATYDHSTGITKGYINGELVGSNTRQLIGRNYFSLYIGTGRLQLTSTSTFFSGTMKYFRVYDKVLTVDEINNKYQKAEGLL